MFKDLESPLVVIGGFVRRWLHLRGGFTSYVTKKLVINLIRNVNDMGAIAVYIFVLLVANVAGLYYYFDDKRNAKRNQETDARNEE